MKKVIMWKYFNPDRLFGGWGWSIEKVWDDWNHIYSAPYYVEIPDDFHIKKTAYGQLMYFRDGWDYGYDLSKTSSAEVCTPLLIGGKDVETVKVRVIGPAPDDAE